MFEEHDLESSAFDWSCFFTLAETFFDHLLRSGESYSRKRHYVCENPVRAGLAGKLKTGRIPVRSSRWNIARGINVRRSQTVATEMIIRDASEPNLPAIVDIYNAAIATHGSGTL